jgi:hypothetical protein
MGIVKGPSSSHTCKSGVQPARSHPARALCLTAALAAALACAFWLGQARAAEVTYDRFSLMIDGKRVFILSGEFHYWRLPSPDLWPDILGKIRAAGYNAVRIVFPWSYHSPAPGVYEFEGTRDVARLLEECTRQGLYVLAAPGPYICGETDAGGFPGWLLSRPLGLRCLDGFILPKPRYDAEYVQTWSRQWFSRILPLLARYQITRDPPGPVILVQIENEYPESLFRIGTLEILPGMGERRYMEELVAMARQYGIDVPLFHNDFPPAGSWSEVVDLSAFDLYPYIGGAPAPGSPPWNTKNTLRPLLDQTESLVRSYGGPAERTPLFIAELQGGWYDGWGSTGYDAAYDFFGPDYFSILDKSLLGQGFSLLNRYMLYGGTNWGYLSNPEVYTSYDYSAAIREWGVLSTTYAALKRTAMFVEAFPELVCATERVEPPSGASEDPRPLYRVRQSARPNPDGSHPRLTFLRNGDGGEDFETAVFVDWGGLSHRVPQDPNLRIPVYGRSMRIVVSNYDMGGLHLLYSTFELLTRLEQRGRTILCVYARRGERGEIAFSVPVGLSVSLSSPGLSWDYKEQGEAGTLLIRGMAGPEPLFFMFSVPGAEGSWIIVLLDEALAGNVWRCPSAGARTLLIGPYLGLDASALQGEGDPAGARPQAIMYPVWVDVPSHVYVLADPGVSSVSVRGGSNPPPERIPELDLFHFHLLPDRPPAVPELGPWRFTLDAPEIEPGYDDSAWVDIPAKASLSPDQYGLHYGFVWYRGRYRPGTGALPLALILDARHSYSVYWNGAFLGSHDTYSASFMAPGAAGSPDLLPDPCVFRIPRGLVRDENTIAVLTESLGHNKGFAVFPDISNPRGIISWSIVGDHGGTVSWKIHGQSEAPDIDPFNSSGLHGELEGYYRTEFDDTEWKRVDLPHDWESDPEIGQGTTGVAWYRTTFELDLPDRVQFPLGLFIGKAYSKALVWLNGRLLGRFWEKMGPQRRFYLPQGVLDPHGRNTLALCVWRMGDEEGNPDPGLVGDIRLEPYPFDHRVSGFSRDSDAGPMGEAPLPFSATRYDIVVSQEEAPSEAGARGPAASADRCGACRSLEAEGRQGVSAAIESLVSACAILGWSRILKSRSRARRRLQGGSPVSGTGTGAPCHTVPGERDHVESWETFTF